MHPELVYIAELNTMERELGRKLTPIEPGCGVGHGAKLVRQIGLVIRWRRKKLRASTPKMCRKMCCFRRVWQPALVFGRDTRPAYFSLSTHQLAGRAFTAEQTRPAGDGFPATCDDIPAHDYLLKVLRWCWCWAIMIGVRLRSSSNGW